MPPQIIKPADDNFSGPTESESVSSIELHNEIGPSGQMALPFPDDGSFSEITRVVRPVSEIFGPEQLQRDADGHAAFNFYVGQRLARGESLEAVLDQMVRPSVDLSSKAFRQALDTMVSGSHAPGGGTAGELSFVAGKDGHRPAYNGEHGATDLYRSLAASGVWNTPFSSVQVSGTGKPAEQYNVNLSWPELAALRGEVDAILSSGQIKVVLPFATEPGTARFNTGYAMDRVGPSNVVSCSADRCSSSTAEVKQLAQGTGAVLASQAEVLACIDWKTVCEECGIPQDQKHLPPGGSKGLTMLAGVLVLAAQDKLDGYVAFHDTDIGNPHIYDCLRYLALPLARPTVNLDPQIIMLGKTGPGRNNEGWTGSANKIATSSGIDPYLRKAARLAGTIIWPLTDARLIGGKELVQIPWTTGMSIETQINAYFAGLQAERGTPLVAQTCNGLKKLERENPDPVREYALMERCQRWLEAVLHHANASNDYLHQFDLNAIRRFNNTYGGEIVDAFFQSPHDGPNVPTSFGTDFMLPSIKQLMDLDAIDFDRLKPLAYS